MKNYSKFVELTNKSKIYNFPSDLIKEGLIKSVDFDTFVKRIEVLFSKYDETVNIQQFRQGVMITIDITSFDKKLYDEFLSILNVCGYLISYYFYVSGNIIKGYPELPDMFNKDYTTITLNAIKKFDIENFEGIPEYLYHVTEKKYLNKILEKGLIPRSNSKIEKHPERIYVTNSIKGAISFKDTLENMYTDLNFVILKIDTKLLKTIKLYYDPIFFENEEDYKKLKFKAFYTYENISPTAIEVIN